MTKVLHISYLDSGGAGRAAVRLHKSLIDMGIDSKVLCLYKNTNEEGIFKYNNNHHIVKRALVKTGILKTQKEKNRRLLSKYEKTFFIFTFPVTDYKIHTHSLVKEADIIHLHWVSGFIDYPSFFKHVDKPIVWTIHDKNPTMGGYHLAIDRDNNALNDINKLEEKHQEIKQQALLNKENITIVAPSKFLTNYSSHSNLLGKFKHEHIYNSIDLEIFKPRVANGLAKKYGLSKDMPALLFMSEGMDHLHKGGDLLLTALKMVSQDFTILTVGRGKIDGLKNNIHIGEIKDDVLLSEIYSMADAAVIPSREDNLPNVMVEAMACGTPVIGTPVGGMMDVIKDGHNGLLAKDITPTDIKEVIEKFLSTKDTFNRNAIREFAVENFSMEKQAREYLNLYNSVV